MGTRVSLSNTLLGAAWIAGWRAATDALRHGSRISRTRHLRYVSMFSRVVVLLAAEIGGWRKRCVVVRAGGRNVNVGWFVGLHDACICFFIWIREV